MTKRLSTKRALTNQERLSIAQDIAELELERSIIIDYDEDRAEEIENEIDEKEQLLI